MMVRAAGFCHNPCVLELAFPWGLESDGGGFQVLPCKLVHDGNNGAGINPARKECAKWNICDHALRDRRIEPIQEFPLQIFPDILPSRKRGLDIPVSLD